MATINYLLKTTKDPSNIYLRFSVGRGKDFVTRTNLFINPQFWDKKNQKIKNVIAVPNRDVLNNNLAKLKINILEKYNLDYTQGINIDANWLKNTLLAFFNQTHNITEKHKIYFSDFAKHWLDNQKSMTNDIAYYYSNALLLFNNFQNTRKIKIADVDDIVITNFGEYLLQNKKQLSSAKRTTARIKFFLDKADEQDLKINKNYKKQIILKEIEEIDDYKHPYLNLKEIEILFNLDLTDETLDNCRDLLIIGLHTGLRFSDYSRLNLDNISDGYIEIKAKKTKTNVAIPVHPHIVKTLNKRLGFLPKSYGLQKFNAIIRKIGELCKFDEIIYGGLKKGGVKKYAMYKKYELMSSHICRRSFCTNLFGKIPNSDLMAIAGWKSESQMLEYVKKTNRESAENLKKYWEQIEN